MKSKSIGIIGLGRMGGGIAKRALRAGFEVVGYDVSPEAQAAFQGSGGLIVDSPCELGCRCEVVALSLSSDDALRATVSGDTGLVRALHRDSVIVEMSTLALTDKLWLLEELIPTGAAILDCPLSGTAAQLSLGDTVVYASGPQAAIDRVSEFFNTFSRTTFSLGEYGNGSRVKFLANLLVTIHNTAAAEVLILAKRASLDLPEVLKALAAGAGNSRMLEIRGPMMVSGEHSPATMPIHTFLKDLRIIGEFANEAECPVPLFRLSAGFYAAAEAQGLGTLDTAAVHVILERMAKR